MVIRRIGWVGLLAAMLAASPWSGAGGGRQPKDSVPLGLSPRVWPADNPYSAAKSELGRRLFFDPRLSLDATVSCASCHDPKHAFADDKPASIGIRGQAGKRNAPTLVNRAYGKEQFWDGRAASLEAQVAGPITNPLEMGNSVANCLNTLRAIPDYSPAFAGVFGSREITMGRIAKAIATFERTILSGNSPYDRYKAGEKGALSELLIAPDGSGIESR